jgi:hypothetical protein
MKKTILIGLILLIPCVYSVCLTQTEILQINNIEQQLNLTAHSLEVIFEDMCNSHATKAELNLTESRLNSRLDNFNTNTTSGINSMFSAFRNETNTLIENKTAAEVSKYTNSLDMGKKLLDVILILNRSSEWEEWKRETTSKNDEFIDSIDTKMEKFRDEYTTKSFLEDRLNNYTFYHYQPETPKRDYTIYIFIGVCVILGGIVLYSKFRSKAPQIIHTILPVREKDVKELQFYKEDLINKEDLGKKDEKQTAKAKDKR